MESSYGIGVTNRYDLFCMDDDAHDPGDSVLNRKAKQKKAAAKAAAAAAAAGGAEKENKAIIAWHRLARRREGSYDKSCHGQSERRRSSSNRKPKHEPSKKRRTFATIPSGPHVKGSSTTFGVVYRRCV